MKHVANAIALLLPLVAITHLIVTIAERTAPAPARRVEMKPIKTPDLDSSERPREASSVAGVSIQRAE